MGQRANGRILLVAVDGRQPGYSVGMTNFELALAMMRLGAVTASALDAGDSADVAFDGVLLNRPSGAAGELPVAEALLIGYRGVYAASRRAVLSPNLDGVAEQQALAYKLVKPSTVEAKLIAPTARRASSTRARASPARTASLGRPRGRGRHRFRARGPLALHGHRDRRRTARPRRPTATSSSTTPCRR